MDMDFHVKSYCQLFDKLQKNVKTVEELFSLLKEQMQEIVRLFPLGKFEIRLIVAPSILDLRDRTNGSCSMRMKKVLMSLAVGNMCRWTKPVVPFLNIIP